MGKILRRFREIFTQTHPSVEEEEMEQIIRSADTIFYDEKYEGSLFSAEISMLDGMIAGIEEFVEEAPERGASSILTRQGAPEPMLQELILLFDRWRDEAVRKLAALRTVHKSAGFIIKMAEVCESYEEKLSNVMKLQTRATPKQLAQVTAIRNQITKAMKLIESNSEEIDAVLRNIGGSIQKVIDALEGRVHEGNEFGLVKVVHPDGAAAMATVPEFLHHFRSSFMQIEAARVMVDSIINKRSGYKAILVRQLQALDNFGEAVEKIESIDRQVGKIMTRERTREKGAKSRMRRLTRGRAA